MAAYLRELQAREPAGVVVAGSSESVLPGLVRSRRRLPKWTEAGVCEAMPECRSPPESARKTETTKTRCHFPNLTRENASLEARRQGLEAGYAMPG